jgi:hypothetical protein
MAGVALTAAPCSGAERAIVVEKIGSNNRISATMGTL